MLQDALDCWYELQRQAMDRTGTYETLFEEEFADLRSALHELELLSKKVAASREEVIVSSTLQLMCLDIMSPFPKLKLTSMPAICLQPVALCLAGVEAI